MIETNKEKLERLNGEIEKNIPGFAILSNRDSALMRLLSKLLFFNKGFTTQYVTVIYPKLYVPELPWYPNDPRRAFEVLAHEYVHLQDTKRMGKVFDLLYLTPQIFALAALGAFWNLSFLWALLFLLPLPSPGRAYLEFRGYRMSMAVAMWQGRNPNIEWMVKQFTTGAYYWMFPFKKYLTNKFQKEYNRIEAGDYEPELKNIKDKFFTKG